MRDNLTAREVEKQIRVMRYTGMGLPKSEVVENARFPSFAAIFYKRIFDDNCIPDEDLFVYSCLSTYFDKVEKDKCRLKEDYRQDHRSLLFELEPLKGRMLRTYPSFIRDYHFYLLCSESDLFEKSMFSLYQDTKKGVDVTVTYEGQSYHVCLFVNTKRSRYYKNKKKDRHSYEGIREIPLSLNFKECSKIGDFYVCNRNHIKQVVNEIKLKFIA